jgi:hypothetical protein
LIKIKEVTEVTESTVPGKIKVTLENNDEKTFENYPIIIKSKDIKHLIYKVQKSSKSKTTK